MKRIVYRPAADADLEGIWDYTLETWGWDQAVRYDQELVERIEGLATGRTASQTCNEVAAGLRRALAGQHVVFFREGGEVVTVVRVLHQRMEPTTHLGRLGA